MKKLMAIIMLCGVVSSTNIYCDTTQNKMLIATTAVIIANVANGLLFYAKNNYLPDKLKAFLEAYKIDVAVATGSNALAAIIVKKYLSKNEVFRKWFFEMTVALAKAKIDLNEGGDKESISQDLDVILSKLDVEKSKNNDPVKKVAVKELKRKAKKYHGKAQEVQFVTDNPASSPKIIAL